MRSEKSGSRGEASTSVGSATRSRKRRFWFAGTALLAAVLAVFAAKPLGSVAAAGTGALMGLRMKSATGPGGAPAAGVQGHAIQEELRKATLQLGIPAQLATIAQWDDFTRASIALLNQELAHEG